ncbi:MAG TPA: biopolymer transporter ExbD [Gammaproteobacteria bacterium]|nr:biopolymer transporter ExbD [Gammaproteobacteria bacterium]
MAYRRRKLMGEINIIPLVDVVLVLLVVFMMTAPMLTRGVDVDLPQVDAAPLHPPEEPLVVTVRKSGAIYLEKTRIDDPRHDLSPKVKAILAEHPDRPVVVNGDQGAAYGAVAKTLELLRRGGVRDVGLQTRPVGN